MSIAVTVRTITSDLEANVPCLVLSPLKDDDRLCHHMGNNYVQFM